jgi:hypothetical protein
LPGHVNALVQVVGRGRRRHPRPKGLHDLLAVEAPSGRQGQQLDQVFGFP